MATLRPPPPPPTRNKNKYKAKWVAPSVTKRRHKLLQQSRPKPQNYRRFYLGDIPFSVDFTSRCAWRLNCKPHLAEHIQTQGYLCHPCTSGQSYAFITTKVTRSVAYYAMPRFFDKCRHWKQPTLRRRPSDAGTEQRSNRVTVSRKGWPRESSNFTPVVRWPMQPVCSIINALRLFSSRFW